jgi:hypothetical protein
MAPHETSLTLMRIASPLKLVFAGLLLFSGCLFAQDQESNQSQPQQDVASASSLPATDGKADSKPEAKTNSVPVQAEQDKRILGVLPNYRTADGTKEFVPMTASGKMRIALKDSFDYPNFIVAGALAGIYQLQNSNPSFGQGAEGYAHRYATAVGDQIIGNMLTEGIMSSVLREDPRYFRKVNGKFWPRFGYSITRVLVAKNDHGAPCVNFAEILGNGISASIGNLYYPDNRGFGNTMQRMGTSIATDTISNVLKEFWPDIKRHFHHPSASAPAVAPSVAP